MYDAGDIFELPKNRNEAVCITTNGIVKKNGCAVMGAGIAKQANMSFNGLARDLGALLSQYGNRVYDMGFRKDNVTGEWIKIITSPQSTIGATNQIWNSSKPQQSSSLIFARDEESRPAI